MGNPRAMGNAQASGEWKAPSTSPRSIPGRSYPGTLAGWGPGQASTRQPACGPDLRICRNLGLRRQEQEASHYLGPRE